MPGPVFAEGERVELRTVEREDVEFVQRVQLDPGTRTHLGFVHPKSKEQVETFYENTIAATNGDTNLLVCDDGEALGAVDLFDVEHDHGTVAYWLAPDARGEGYATEGLSLLLDYAFDTRGLHHVVAEVFEFNDASRALVERLGFEQEGRLREHVFARGEYHDVVQYGLLAEEWNSSASESE
jgi:RimJ/RimL family protein N-acetyltransferase